MIMVINLAYLHDKQGVLSMNKDRIELLKKDYIQGFPAYCGFEVLQIGEGVFEARFMVRPEHKQQDGYVHAGVLATLADHTAGYSAYTIVPHNERILTIEFKINYFKPAIGNQVICKSKVINQGKNIIVAESELYDLVDKKERLISKATVTLVAVSSKTPFNNTT
jgi:uncharacterized protein (TIGR00369 family)